MRTHTQTHVHTHKGQQNNPFQNAKTSVLKRQTKSITETQATKESRTKKNQKHEARHA